MAEKTMYVDLDMGHNQLLNTLLEVSLTVPIGGQEGQLYYDATNKDPMYFDGTQWQNFGKENISEMDDVNITGVAGGEYLIYNVAAGEWRNNILTFKLSDGNVNPTSTTGQILYWNNLTSTWEPGDPPSGLGINNPGVDRLVLSGISASNNLEAQELLLFENDFRFSVIAEPTPLIRTEMDPASGGPSAGAIYGVIGMNDGLSNANHVLAGITAIASENHIGNNRGTIVAFENTKAGTGGPSNAFVISSENHVIINPNTNSEDYETDFHVRGGHSFRTRTVTGTNNTVDDSGNFDSTIIADCSSGNVTILFPGPGSNREGRRVIIKRCDHGNNGSILTLTTTLSGFYTVSTTSSFTMPADGDVSEFICAQSNGTWYWMVSLSQRV